MKSINQEQLIHEFLTEIDYNSNSILKITTKRYRDVLFNFWLKKSKEFKKSLLEFGKKDFKKLLESIKDEYKPRSIRNYFSILSSFFSYLIDEDVIGTNVLKGLKLKKIAKRDPIFLEDSEIQKFIRKLLNFLDKNCADYYQNIATNLLPIVIGCRVSEQSNLDLDSLNFEKGIVTIIGKGNKERKVPLPIEDDFFMEIMQNHLNEREKRLINIANKIKLKADSSKEPDSLRKYQDKVEYISKQKAFFINSRGNRLSTRDIQRSLKHIRENIGLEFMKLITPHKYRHTFGTRLSDAGVDINKIKEMLGHENITTTQIYAHVTQKAIRKEMSSKKPFSFNNITD
jgi:site-specific recombinase XerD